MGLFAGDEDRCGLRKRGAPVVCRNEFLDPLYIVRKIAIKKMKLPKFGNLF